MYSSYELFEQVGFERAEMYRKDSLYDNQLKDTETLRLKARGDFSRYEDGIRHLLTT